MGGEPYIGENMKELIVQYSNNGFSAEVVGEIVRCKDCEYGEQNDSDCWYCRGLGCQI